MRCQQLVSRKGGLNICTKGRRGDWLPIFRDVGEVSWDSLYFITIIYCPVYSQPLLETSCSGPAFRSSQLIVQQTSCMPSIPLRRLISVFIIPLLLCGSSLNNGVALSSLLCGFRVHNIHAVTGGVSGVDAGVCVFSRSSSPETLRHGQGHAVGQTCQSQDGTTFKRNPASLSVSPHFILSGSIIYRGTSCCIE